MADLKIRELGTSSHAAMRQWSHAERAPLPDKRSFYLACTLAALAFCATPAFADCRPDGVFQDGDTIVCTGVDSNGWPSEPPPDGTPSDDIPQPPFENLRIEVHEDAMVLGTPEAIGFLGNFSTVINEGTVSSSGFGTEAIGIFGTGNTVANIGDVEATGDEAEGIGLEGTASRVTNSGFVTVNGEDSEGIGIEGATSTIINNGSVGMIGNGTSAIGIEGDDAVIRNPGAVAVQGVLATGLSADGTGAEIYNSGSVNMLAAASAGISVLGEGYVIDNTGRVSLSAASVAAGGVGDGGTVTNSGIVDASGADSIGLMGLGAGSTVTNEGAGTITMIGDRSIGISVGVPNDLIRGQAAANAIPIPPSTGSVENDNDINVAGVGSRGIATDGDSITIDNNKLLAVSGAGSQAIDFTGSGAVVRNSTDANIVADGAGSIGIAGGRNGTRGDDADVENLGKILAGATGTSGARGIEVTGDRLRVVNGTGRVGQRAEIILQGDYATGISVNGVSAFVSNQANVSMEGSGSTAVQAVTGTAGATRIENKADLSVVGAGSRGIVVKGGAAGAGLPEIDISGIDRGCLVRIPGSVRNIANCGKLTLAGNDARGLAVEAISNANIENHQGISGAGENIIGMSVTAGAGPDLSPNSGNRITNFDEIVLEGDSVTGMFVRGQNNQVFFGSGTTVFPNGDLITSFLDLVSNQDPAGTGPRAGYIQVIGPNATGIAIEGTGNAIGLREFGDILASGAGGAAVSLSGGENLLVADGEMRGRDGALAIRGSAGVERILMDGVIVGDTELFGGDDEYSITDRTIQVGSVNGGVGTDTLRAIIGLEGIRDPVTASKVLDGDEFTSFEKFVKQGDGEVVLENSLTVDSVVHDRGKLTLSAGSQLSVGGSITMVEGPVIPQLPEAINPKTRLQIRKGSTLFASTIDMMAGTEACLGGRFVGRWNVAQGAKKEVGCSIGTGTIDGDLFSAGLIEFEFAAFGAGQYDILNVLGLADFSGGTLLFSFLNGFTPTLGSSVKFLFSDELLGLDTASIAYSGLGAGYEFGFDFSSGGLSILTTAVAGGPGTPPTAVPEPSTWLLMLLGIGMIVVARRQAEGGKSGSNQGLSY